MDHAQGAAHPALPGLAASRPRRLGYLPVFAAYVALLFWTAWRHEPWADEAQAWLIARDLPVPYLVARFLRYEGSPALWHLILSVPAKLHAPYALLNLLGATFAASGVALLLWKSPLPRLLNALLPFTFFVLYQYAVVARSYVLLLPALVLVALAARRRGERPVRFAGAALLLANTCVHGATIACSLMALELGKLILRWKMLDRPARRRRLVALGVFGAGMALLAVQLYPPRDLILFRNRFPVDLVPAIGHKYLREAFCGAALPTVLVLAVSVAWFRRAGVLAEFLVPLAGLLALFSLVYANLWHSGTLFLAWLYAAWRRLPMRRARRSRPAHHARAGRSGWSRRPGRSCSASTCTGPGGACRPISGSPTPGARPWRST